MPTLNAFLPQVLALTMILWSKRYKSPGLQAAAADKLQSPTKTEVAISEEQRLNWFNESLTGIERRARFHWLTLLVEWDKKDQINTLLRGIENDQYFNKSSLNNALQVALENDRCCTPGIPCSFKGCNA